MICEFCGGRVEWQGPLSDLTHTKCLQCGEINCQIVDEPMSDEFQNDIQAAFGGIVQTPQA